MVGLGTNHHLYYGKAKISVTYKSDQTAGTIYFYMRNCVPSAAMKRTKYEKVELRDSPLLLISDSNTAQLNCGLKIGLKL